MKGKTAGKTDLIHRKKDNFPQSGIPFSITPGTPWPFFFQLNLFYKTVLI
jgi:hypothetical protein